MALAIPLGLDCEETDSSLSSEPPGLTPDVSSTASTVSLSAMTSELLDSIDCFTQDADLLLYAYESCQTRTVNHIPDVVINELIRQYDDGDPKFDLSTEPMQKLVNNLKYRILMVKLTRAYVRACGFDFCIMNYRRFSYTHWRQKTTKHHRVLAEGAISLIIRAQIFPRPRNLTEGRRFEKPMQYMAVEFAKSDLCTFQVKLVLETQRELFDNYKGSVFCPCVEITSQQPVN